MSSGVVPFLRLDRVATALDVAPDEGRIVALFLVHSFCIGLTQTLAQTAGYTLFLTHWTAATLPYAYVGITVAAIAVALAHIRLQARFAFGTLMIGDIAFIIALLILCRVLLLPPAFVAGAAFMLPIAHRTLQGIFGLEFWALAVRSFDVRQGKRLFGLIGVGRVVGSICGGLLTPLLVALLSTPNLLLVAAVAAIGALVFLVRILRHGTVDTEAQTSAANSAAQPRLWHDPYMLLILIIAGLMVIEYLFIDTVFYDQARTQFPDAAALASFIGLYEAALGIVTLVGMLVVFRRLQRRGGVASALATQPLLVGISAALAIGATLLGSSHALTLGFVTLARISDIATADAISRPTLGLLYQPLPFTQRLQAQTLAGSLVPALAALVAAAVLLLLIQGLGFTPFMLLYVLAIVIAVWLWQTPRIKREYRRMLIQAISKRRFDGATLQLLDHDSMTSLQRALTSDRPDIVLYAIRMLNSVTPVAIKAYIDTLLVHRMPEIRVAALDFIESHRLATTTQTVETLATDDPDAAVRDRALIALAALDGTRAVALLTERLDATDLAVRHGALVGLLRYGGAEGAHHAASVFDALVRSSDAPERALAARICGTVGGPTMSGALTGLLADDDPTVRRAAFAASGVLADDTLWSTVVEGLQARDTRSIATTALVTGEEGTLPALRTAFDAPTTPREVRLSIIRVYKRLGGTGIPSLIALLRYDDGFVRTHVLQALSQFDDDGSMVEYEEQINAAREAEFAEAAFLAAAIADIPSKGATTLVRDALTQRLQRTSDRILLLHALVYDREALLQARRVLLAASTQQRAYAIEVLDTTLPQAHAARTIALIEDLDDLTRLRRLDPASVQPRLVCNERLHDLLLLAEQADGAWIAAVALHALVELDDPYASSAVLTASNAHVPLMRNTAMWLHHRITARSESEHRGR